MGRDLSGMTWPEFQAYTRSFLGKKYRSSWHLMNGEEVVADGEVRMRLGQGMSSPALFYTTSDGTKGVDPSWYEKDNRFHWQEVSLEEVQEASRV